MNSYSQDLVQVRREAEIAVVVLNRSALRNILSREMKAELIATLRRLHDDAQTRAIVLTGEGGHFCAGDDAAEMIEFRTPALELRERLAQNVQLFRALACGAKPVVAAVEGTCRGSGMSVAAGCDYVVGSGAAHYGCDFIGKDLLPDMGLLWSLPQRVGAGKARELMLGGKNMDGEEAGRIGLVNEVVPPGRTLAKAMEVAAQLGSLPPVTLALLKAALVNGMNTIEDAWRLEIDMNPLTRQTQDHHEAVAAFIEKRRPHFIGN